MTRVASLYALAGLLASATSFAGAPDLVIGGITGVSKWTPTPGPNGTQAYSFGIVTCNVGDGNAAWNASSPQHPVFGQNLHRIRNGRIEQIGLGFAFHGFSALAQNACGLGCSSTGDVQLQGPGCSTPDTANFLGSQSSLAPRSTVNASTGGVVFPFQNPSCSPASLCERVQVAESDLSDPDAIYLSETVVVHFQDAAAGATSNNASSRRFAVNSAFSMVAQGELLPMSAVRAWRELNNNGSPDADILIDQVIIPNDGVVEVGSKAIPIGNGRWRYVIAVENISSDRSLSGLVVFMGADPAPQGFTFHAPDYHSGEVYDNADWPLFIGDASFRWLSPQSFNQNPNTNALRWGTLYTFTFTSTAAPAEGAIVLNIFKPGAINGVSASAVVPGAVSSYCPGDGDNNGVVNFADLNILLGTYGLSGVDLNADANGDGEIGFDDLNLLLGRFGQSC